ncbi:hypothetical protein BST98_21400 (plasmid) [Photobacterium damselae]|nr:hypothetical protein BST98_21400 [Photobacterium damselae]
MYSHYPSPSYQLKAHKKESIEQNQNLLWSIGKHKNKILVYCFMVYWQSTRIESWSIASWSIGKAREQSLGLLLHGLLRSTRIESWSIATWFIGEHENKILVYCFMVYWGARE